MTVWWYGQIRGAVVAPVEGRVGHHGQHGVAEAVHGRRSARRGRRSGSRTGTRRRRSGRRSPWRRGPGAAWTGCSAGPDRGRRARGPGSRSAGRGRLPAGSRARRSRPSRSGRRTPAPVVRDQRQLDPLRRPRRTARSWCRNRRTWLPADTNARGSSSSCDPPPPRTRSTTPMSASLRRDRCRALPRYPGIRPSRRPYAERPAGTGDAAVRRWRTRACHGNICPSRTFDWDSRPSGVTVCRSGRGAPPSAHDHGRPRQKDARLAHDGGHRSGQAEVAGAPAIGELADEG